MSGHPGPKLNLRKFKRLKVGNEIEITFREEGAPIGREMTGWLRVTLSLQESTLQAGSKVLSVEAVMINSPIWPDTDVVLKYYERNGHMLLLKR